MRINPIGDAVTQFDTLAEPALHPDEDINLAVALESATKSAQTDLVTPDRRAVGAEPPADSESQQEATPRPSRVITAPPASHKREEVQNST